MDVTEPTGFMNIGIVCQSTNLRNIRKTSRNERVMTSAINRSITGAAMSKAVNIRREGFFHLLVVYFAWGSTFLGIRYAVQGEGAFAPLTLATLRVGLSGFILLSFATLRGHSLRVERDVLQRLAITGILLWGGGHALLIWAAQWADSGFGAILFASIPLWTAIIEAVRDPRARSLKLLFPVLLGFCGIVVLTLPTQLSQTSPEISAAVHQKSNLLLTTVILVSAFSWALGSTLTTAKTNRLPVSVSAGYQQLFAAIVCLIFTFVLQESWRPPSAQAMLALSYLILIGSVLAFSSYVRALQLLPNKLVASFAYVNPVIAVALGSWLANEAVSSSVLLGATLVIASVIWLFQTNTTEKIDS